MKNSERDTTICDYGQPATIARSGIRILFLAVTAVGIPIVVFSTYFQLQWTFDDGNHCVDICSGRIRFVIGRGRGSGLPSGLPGSFVLRRYERGSLLNAILFDWDNLYVEGPPGKWDIVNVPIANILALAILAYWLNRAIRFGVRRRAQREGPTSG